LSRRRDDFWVGVVGIGGSLAVAIAVWVFQSGIEQKVWNRCHPDMPITRWEAMWATTRIDQCDP